MAGSLTGVAGTAYYRWTDERGNTIHSDRPPPTGVDYEVARTGSSFKRPVSSGEGAVPLATEPGGDSQLEQADDSSKARSQKDPELCARARDNLDALTNSDRVTMRNEKGEVHVLTAQEIKMSIETTHGQIDAYCE
jgi:hypothetical protein